jgi:hypothetical protein
MSKESQSTPIQIVPTTTGELYIQDDKVIGKKVVEPLRTIYMKGDMVHRSPKEGPAVEERNSYGKVVRRAYVVDNVPHRDDNDGPAEIQYDDSGNNRLCEKYYKHGKLHRVSSPAVVVRSPSGIITRYEYWTDGVCTRADNKPAVAEWSAVGSMSMQKYMVGGQLHRNPECGPAVIIYRDNGKDILEEQYWVEGKKMEHTITYGEFLALKQKLAELQALFEKIGQ